MLIPGNIPNIISAGKLGITSKEWARLGVPPLGLSRWLSISSLSSYLEYKLKICSFGYTDLVSESGDEINFKITEFWNKF